ncbi:MAG: universal stress protein [Deltaproteobacteria bacterium]|nr:universal stress protein [Deltaproteobacteria bacterium]
MYKNILVPLDGSELAESALVEAGKIAKLINDSKLVLLTVVKIPSVLVADGVEGLNLPKFKQSQFDKSQKYLAEIESRLSSEGIKATSDVIEGAVAESIVEYSLKNAIDLIVIATHGYTGMKKLMLGSVALSVLHDSHVPVLLIRPEGSRK